MVRTLFAAAVTLAGFSLGSGSPGSPVAGAQDEYRFSRDLRAGQTLAISNIDGNVTITRGNGRTATVVVTKKVRRGNGDLVKAILEETGDGIKVCTVYLRTADEDRTRCRGTTSGDHRNLDVEMTYEVRMPDGVRLDAATVDGDLRVEGADTPGTISTVDGNVTYRGAMPARLSSVDGDITLDVIGAIPDGARVTTVDGNVTITLPATAALDLSASTVDGDITSDFPLTVKGKWGPRTMRGEINGGGPTLRLSTVDGSLTIRRR
jgi:hypothetical protein